VTETYDALASEIAKAMNDINDLSVKYEDFAEVAIEVLEKHGLTLPGDARDDVIIEVGDAISDVQTDEAHKGNYSPSFEVYAEAALVSVVKQGFALPLKTLAEVLPPEFTQGEYHDTPAYRLRDVGVVTVYGHYGKGRPWKGWPGRQRNVFLWVVLANGNAVGFNEGVRGWGFPVIKYTP
jgi:hypothetical protein